MANLDQEVLQAELKKKRICRFCLTQEPTKISNIYMRDTRIKSSAPLPIQIMAIASIEVFNNDGMPPFVCNDCTSMFEYNYQFKQMCKKADNLLRQFPLTGKWPQPLEKPTFPTIAGTSSVVKQSNKTTQVRMQSITKAKTQQESLLLPKKILNSAVKNATESVITPDTSPKSINITTTTTTGGSNKNTLHEEECTITFLEKIENNEELSFDDIHQLVAAEEINETEFVDTEDLPHVVVDSGNKTTKPKLLNKASVKILNKQAAQDLEPRLSLPKFKKDVDGKMEIVAEILNINEAYEDEPDPKNAVPIETNIFPCPHCERTFPLVQLRDLHMKNHSRDRKFQCEECEKSFFSKYDLKRHSSMHNGSKPYTCSACGKGFSRSSLLARHEKTHTDVPKFICIHCERSFISKEDMEKHADRHNINRPFVCKLCNKRFVFKQGLERHEVVHSREQPFSCQYCDLSFSTTTKLTRHLTAHAGQRPFPCKYCKKSFLLSHHLTRHLRSHRNLDKNSTDIIKFMCCTCKTSFNSRDELIQHSTTHANEANLVCPLCKDVFNDINVLNKHIQEHSEGEAYACEFCDLIFMAADKLQAHTDLEHAEEMEVYHADDRAKEDIQQINDEKLQNDVNAFLNEQEEEEEETTSKPESPLKTKIKTEKPDSHSPKIINQIIIRSANETQNDENKQDEDNESLLIPMKQRKLDTGIKSPQQQITNKQSPQLRRKTPNAAGSITRDANQPTIQSILKINKNVTVTKTPPTTKTNIVVTDNVPKPKAIKLEKDLIPAGASTSSSPSTSSERKVKVQKITVTKAQAAAMAKEGRIKIKDGKIILNK